MKKRPVPDVVTTARVEDALERITEPRTKPSERRRYVKRVLSIATTAAGALAVATAFRKHKELWKAFVAAVVSLRQGGYLLLQLAYYVPLVQALLPVRQAASPPPVPNAPVAVPPARVTAAAARKLSKWLVYYVTHPTEWVYVQPIKLMFKAGQTIVRVLDPRNPTSVLEIPLAAIDINALDPDALRLLVTILSEQLR